MKLCGSTLRGQALRAFQLLGLFWGCGASLILGGCKPAPEPQAAPPVIVPPVPMAPPISVVPIPNEIFDPVPTPPPAKPVLARVVFATADFQVITDHGIQGIQAGDALDFVREDGGDYVVRHGKLEFRKNRSFFASTYEASNREEPTSQTEEATLVPAVAEASLPDEPPLSGIVPTNEPAPTAETKKIGELTDSIRKLNNEIREKQDALQTQSQRSGGSQEPQEVKRATRSIEKLKAQRDELSGQLTEMGKP